jgi:hypothetical protein
MEGGGMKVIELVAENIKRLKAVELRPPGGLVVVGGRNEQGKSTLLDCINAMAGRREMSEQMLREGMKKGRIELQLDGPDPLRVVFTFTKKTTSVKVMGADGKARSSPQTILDGLYSKIAFDPSVFQRMKPKEQVEMLRLLDPSLDFTALSEERASLYAERTGVNKDLDRARLEFSSLPHFADAPDEPVAVADLMATLGEMEAQARTNSEIERASEAAEAASADINKRIEAAAVSLRQLQADGLHLHQEAQAAKERSDAIRNPDIEPIRAQLVGADETNGQVRQNQQRQEAQAAGERLAAETARLTRRMEDIDAAKMKAVEEADLQIEHLGLDDDTVTYKGLPFAQASQSEQRRVSMQIGMKHNPELRVMLCKEGAFFDDEAIEDIRQMADANDYQIWLERVGSGEECSVIIEDGMVAELVTVDRTDAQEIEEVEVV